VDQRVWEQVQKTLQENGRTNGAIVKNKYGALLRGLLVCAHCGKAMVHTYTNKGTRRYRYYVCGVAQQKGWKTCKTKSVGAEPIERAVLTSIRQITTDARLAEAVLAEAVDQYSRRKQELQTEQVSLRRSLKQLNDDLAKLASDTTDDSGARYERISGIEASLRTTQRRLVELAEESAQYKAEPVTAEDLRATLREFEQVWAALTTREQEEMIRLLVSRVVFDGVTGKVTVSFRSAGAKELCQGKAD
jgi:site-specific DNA recombinase